MASGTTIIITVVVIAVIVLVAWWTLFRPQCSPLKSCGVGRTCNNGVCMDIPAPALVGGRKRVTPASAKAPERKVHWSPSPASRTGTSVVNAPSTQRTPEPDVADQLWYTETGVTF